MTSVSKLLKILRPIYNDRILKFEGDDKCYHFDMTPFTNLKKEVYASSFGGSYSKEQYKKRFFNALICISRAFRNIEKGHTWEYSIKDAPKTIRFDFDYPNGKEGDINYFICSELGTIRHIKGTKHRATIQTDRPDEIAKLVFIFDLKRKPFGHIPKKDYRNEVCWFVNKYNYYHQLRQLRDELDMIIGTGNPVAQECYDVANVYIELIRRQRNEIYEYLISNNLTSGKWVSEQKAYAIVKDVYKDAIFQYSADWLGLQTLDIYIPSIKTAIEYQGQQHFKPLSVFGGESGFQATIERDKQKREKCVENGIRLIEWRYNEPLTLEFIVQKIESETH